MSVEEVTGEMHLIQAPLMHQPFKDKQSTITFIYFLSKKTFYSGSFVTSPDSLSKICVLGQ